MGGPRTRRKAREKEKRRKKAAARGVRSKELPPEVTQLLGDANLAYMDNKCAPCPVQDSLLFAGGMAAKGASSSMPEHFLPRSAAFRGHRLCSCRTSLQPSLPLPSHVIPSGARMGNGTV